MPSLTLVSSPTCPYVQRAVIALTERGTRRPLLQRSRSAASCWPPAFRQIATLDSVAPTNLLDGLPKVRAWSDALLARPSVRSAVPEDYAERYIARLRSFGALVLEAA